MKRIGPGPAQFMLPPTVGYTGHDATRYREPMYSMAPVLRLTRATEGPGPARYTTEYKTPYGEKHIPAYMGRQTSQVVSKNVGPGPAFVKLPTLIGSERTRVWMEKSPDYAFGLRLDTKKGQQSPGPLALPDTMGIYMKNIYPNRRPQYSMAKRFAEKKSQGSPGPAQYDSSNKNNCAILITMKGRYPDKIHGKSPGPNQFNLQDHKPGKRPPMYSMGMALSGIASPMIIPGDNC